MNHTLENYNYLSYLGIVSSVNIWKLCWEINHELSYNFTAINEEKFIYFDDQTLSDIELTIFPKPEIAQKKIAKQLEKVDYILQLRSENDLSSITDEISKKIKNLNSVSIVINLSNFENINSYLKNHD